MSLYFECHITLDAADYKIAKYIAQQRNMKISVLKDEGLDGNDKYVFINFRSGTLQDAILAMDWVMNDLRQNYIPVLRKKIEVAIVDQKYD